MTLSWVHHRTLTQDFIEVFILVAYHQWMEEHGGAIVNIIADMWKGMPGMRYAVVAVFLVFRLNCNGEIPGLDTGFQWL